MHINLFLIKIFFNKTFINIINEIDVSRTKSLREFALPNLYLHWNIYESDQISKVACNFYVAEEALLDV